jgi:xanthine/uracil permease
MAGGTIIAPLIMGFDPNRALLFSGLGTLIFFVVVAGGVPSYLGSSFSFVAVVIAASGYSGHGQLRRRSHGAGGGCPIRAGVISSFVKYDRPEAVPASGS